MKKILIPIAIITLIFSSCKTSQIQSYQDDAYVSPAEEKKLEKLAQAEKAKQEAAEKQKREEEALAQKAKDDANPYYQDPQYNSDDYYDYKYASQMRRFQNPVSGAGYYNNYYTNAYMYNQNPAMYGSSIYSSYNWWMPSNQFNNYNNGLYLGFNTGNYYNSGFGYNGYCNNGYNPYYSNNGFCNYGGYSPYGYNSYGYNPYGYGYMNGYNNGYFNGYNSGSNWGYFNSYDVNSGYSNASYGPRGSNGGGNSGRQTSAGMAVPDEGSYRTQFINEIAKKQETTPKFTDVPRKKIYNNSGSENLGNGQINSSEPIKTRASSSSENYPNTNSGTNTQKKEESFWPRVFNENQNTNSTPVKNSNTNSDSGNPVRGENTSPPKIKSSSIENNDLNNSNNSNRSANPGNSSPNNGSSTPRNNSGGSSSRPR
ncbi:MAG: cell envelope integrity protein TolA [Bacteroidota bacterium]|nr:cell envelope integrity protein TolA [Bacteroidota bacterium]